jgi:membrane-bound lytic murein transglycosylase B
MKSIWNLPAVAVAVAAMMGPAGAAECGNTAAGFETWKRQFAEEARAKGVGASAISALMAADYATATIRADRGQRSFRLSLDEFLAKRGGAAIVSRGRALKRTHAALFASIEQRYGVPAGPLLAIWGMETGFGSQRGSQPLVSAIATLAYDCRRSAFFTEQLYATLTLIERGTISPNARGAMHGELGHTQFMPKSILNYGGGRNLDNPDDALMATANFLKGHGWRAGAGYQPGEPNFAALQAWNAASVYQRALAQLGQQIDGDGAARQTN